MAKFLARKGIRIIRRQHKMPSGELDIIAMDGDSIVFVEVKTRRSDSKGHPIEAITPQIPKKLTQLSLTYLKTHGLLNQPTRFDVVTVIWQHGQRKPVIEHYENAFPPVGSG